VKANDEWHNNTRFKPILLVFEGNDVQVVEDDKSSHRAKLVLYPRNLPKRFEYKEVQGSYDGETLPGTYVIDNGQLRVDMVFAGVGFLVLPGLVSKVAMYFTRER
jgi:uncharacterized protein (TIGR03067 family)